MKKLRIIPFLVAAALLASCSTQNTKFLNVAYHNTTCHYNVWWNGNEALKDGVRQLKTKHVDDYTQLLPVYQLGTKEQAMTVFPQMDKSIEKGLKGIKKHSIYQHGREYVKYVKNCYLLTAYGSFYKQDYPAAENAARLIIAQFGASQEADEARIILARCKTLTNQPIDAETQLDQLVNQFNAGDFSPKQADKLYLAMVECLLPQEKYKKAVQYIRLALDETTNNQTRARLYYILAQIYQLSDKRPTATKYYNKVLKSHPTYLMEFNARIAMASCSDVTNNNAADLEKSLDKMLRDRKNAEFHDQIYYAKGEMYLGLKDAKKACDNYKLSVEKSETNPAQKAKSALRMADVLYEVYENYDLAQSYYDTALHIIKPGYPHFDEIRSRHITLTSLVEYTRVIERNDSLIAMADMSPEERNAVIQKNIDAIKKKEEEAKEKQLLDELANEARAQQNVLEGDWYFYNSNTVSKGKETFRQRWGKTRILEDYWFLSKKGTLALGNMVGNTDLFGSDTMDSDSTMIDSTAVAATSKLKDDPNDPHCPAYYLKDLPKTEGQRDTMHAETAQCLLNAGYIFYDGLQNTDRALECYLRMANDYPDAPGIEQAFFQLYRIYDKQGNTPSANYYRDMVLMGFPDCDYANMLRDENYYLQIIKRSQQIKEDYGRFYATFRRHRYQNAITLAEEAANLYPHEHDLGKFRYFEALAYEQLCDHAKAVETLQGIVSTYPANDTISMLASQQLAFFSTRDTSGAAGAVADISAADEAAAKDARFGNLPSKKEVEAAANAVDEELPPESLVFRYRENMQHYVVVIVNDKKIVATQLQYRIGDFNMANYSNSALRASPLMFTDSTQMITIHKFRSAAEAMDYYTHIQLPGGPLENLDRADYVIFPISNQNYSTFYNRKDIEAYRKFFVKYYLK